MASSGDTLQLFPGTYYGNFTLDVAQITLEPVPGQSNPVQLNADTSGTVLTIDPGVTATVMDVGITGGSTVNGGGIYNGGTLMLYGSTVSGNSASNEGGGIYNLGVVTVEASTISGNTTAHAGGGAYNGGTTTFENSSVSSNIANTYGGGIINAGGTVTLKDSTIAEQPGHRQWRRCIQLQLQPTDYRGINYLRQYGWSWSDLLGRRRRQLGGRYFGHPRRPDTWRGMRWHGYRRRLQRG